MRETEGKKLGFKSVGGNGDGGDTEGVGKDQAVKTHGKKLAATGDQSESIGNIAKPSCYTANRPTDASSDRGVMLGIKQKKNRNTFVLTAKSAECFGDRENAGSGGRNGSAQNNAVIGRERAKPQLP